MCSLSHPTCTLLGTCTMIVIKLEVHCFFFNDTAPTEIYTLSLHDALPISSTPSTRPPTGRRVGRAAVGARSEVPQRGARMGLAMGVSGDAILRRPSHGSTPPPSSARVGHPACRPRGRAYDRPCQEGDVPHVP